MGSLTNTLTRRITASLAAAAVTTGALVATTSSSGPSYPSCKPIALHSQGVDFAWGGPTVKAMQGAGKQVAASYLSWDSSKDWQVSQLHAYRYACIRAVPVWESTGNRALSGFTAGAADARQANSDARSLGFPVGQPLYFAVDFDETPAQAAAVAKYFQGVASVIGLKRTGAYGGYWVISRLFNAKLITYGWQTYAWSGGQWDSRAQLRQYDNNVLVGGRDVDLDVTESYHFGQWPAATTAPVYTRTICFGRNRQYRNKACVPIRALAAKRELAINSTEAALLNTKLYLKQHHCRKSYRRDICVDLGKEIRPVLLQRLRWFMVHRAALVKQYS